MMVLSFAVYGFTAFHAWPVLPVSNITRAFSTFISACISEVNPISVLDPPESSIAFMVAFFTSSGVPNASKSWQSIIEMSASPPLIFGG